MEKIKKIEWICAYCGKRLILTNLQGRPQPGKCQRKEGNKPHSWRKNRVMP